MSVVRVVRISGWEPPMVMRPTEDSGLAPVFAENMRLAASHCASHREGLHQLVFANELWEAEVLTDSRHSDCSRCCQRW